MLGKFKKNIENLRAYFLTGNIRMKAASQPSPSLHEHLRIITEDHNLLDVDWARTGAHRLAILTHGTPGSEKNYSITSTKKALCTHGWDILTWSRRNGNSHSDREPTSETSDLQRVFSHALFKKRYTEITLVGFGSGGELVLDFLIEHGQSLTALIGRTLLFSTAVPQEQRLAMVQVPTLIVNTGQRLDPNFKLRFWNKFIKPFGRNNKLVRNQISPWDINRATRLSNYVLLEEMEHSHYSRQQTFKDNSCTYWCPNQACAFLEYEQLDLGPDDCLCKVQSIAS